MRFDPRAGITNLQKAETGRRRRGRIGQEAVRCDVGAVLDLSPSGMRIRCRRIPRGEFMTCIQGLGSEVVLKARVAWTRRVGFLKHEAGIEFLDMTPELAQKITDLGMINRNRRTA